MVGIKKPGASFAIIAVCAFLCVCGALACKNALMDTVEKLTVEYNATLRAPLTPPAPEVTAADSQLTVSWSALLGASDYDVYWSTSNDTATILPASFVTTKILNVTITGLENGTTYFVWLRARNGAGISGYSPSSSGTPVKAETPPAAPAAPVLVFGDGRFSASWTAVEGATSYELYWSTQSETLTIPAANRATTSELSCVVEGLSNGITYYVWLKAVNAIGPSGFSLYASGIPIPPPAAPDKPVLTAGNTQISATWTAVSGASSYDVFWHTVNDSSKIPSGAVKNVTETSCVIDGLVNKTLYYVWLKARNSAGVSAFGPAANCRPVDPPAAPGAPSLNPSDSQLGVSWVAVADATDYDVSWSTVDSTESIPPANKLTTAKTSCAITGLANGTRYYVWIKAWNTGGSSDWGPSSGESPVAATTPPAAPPAPTLVAGDGRIQVSWTTVSGAASYNIYWAESNNPANVLIGDKQEGLLTLSTTITPLPNGIIHYVWVRAVNSIGIGDWSQSSGAKTIATPEKPAMTMGQRQFDISWLGVTGATNYDIYWNTVDDTASIPVANVKNIITSSTTITRSVTGLESNTLYYAWIKARNSSGISDFCTVSSGTTFPEITFDKNDASATGTMGNQAMAHNTSGNLNANAFSKEGWTFSGWATTSGGAVAYANGAGFSMGTENVVLYAKWTANVYSIYFNKNDDAATGSMAPQGISCGSSATLSANGFSKTGWAFAGWSTTPGGTLAYGDQASYTMGPQDVTLYALWNPGITFDKNDGGATGTMPMQVIPSGTQAAIAANAFAKTGWSFSGWATSPGGAVEYANGATFSMGASSVMLYAKWTIDQYWLTVNAGGNGSIAVPASSPVLVTYNTPFEITAVPASLYEFTTWTVTSGTGVSFGAAPNANTTVILTSGPATIQANFSPISGAVQWWRTRADGIAGRFFGTAVDASGNVYAVGDQSTTSPCTYGTSPLVTATGKFTGINSVIVKYNSSGIAQWARTASEGPAASGFFAVAADSSGNVYAAGFQLGTVPFTYGTSPPVSVGGVNSSFNVVLVKYDSSGTAQWARSVSLGSGYSMFSAVAVDSAGNVYAAGRQSGVSLYKYGTSPVVTATGTSSSSNVVLVKYNASGTAQWAKTIVSPSSNSYFLGVAVDFSGNVYATGIQTGTNAYDYGNSPPVSARGSSVNDNAVLVKYTAAGIAQWATSVSNSASASIFNGVAVDGGGNVYAAGSQTGITPFNYGSGIVVPGTSTGLNAVLVRYSNSGMAQWAKSTSITSTVHSYYYGVAVAETGMVYAVGYQNGTGTYNYGGASASGQWSEYNAVLVKYNPMGTAVWANAINTGLVVSINRAVALDGAGNVFVAGSQSNILLAKHFE